MIPFVASASVEYLSSAIASRISRAQRDTAADRDGAKDVVKQSGLEPR
jgi:hypothetical protein